MQWLMKNGKKHVCYKVYRDTSLFHLHILDRDTALLTQSSWSKGLVPVDISPMK